VHALKEARASTHAVARIRQDVEKAVQMIIERAKDSSSVFSAWLGKSVVMLVVIRKCHVPMPCSIVGESSADVRVRIDPGWEMDVRKDLILAVEEDVPPADSRVN
jgi:hypothetical protein